MRWTRCVGCSTGLLRWHLETGCPLNRNLQVESAVVRIRTADHPINSRGLYRTELRRPGRPYKRGTQIVSATKNTGTKSVHGFTRSDVAWACRWALARPRKTSAASDDSS